MPSSEIIRSLSFELLTLFRKPRKAPLSVFPHTWGSKQNRLPILTSSPPTGTWGLVRQSAERISLKTSFCRNVVAVFGGPMCKKRVDTGQYHRVHERASATSAARLFSRPGRFQIIPIFAPKSRRICSRNRPTVRGSRLSPEARDPP